ncbi:E-beta-farnesene synthase [Tanacetum coccineum]
MADVNVNALAEQAPAMAPPARTDDQILPRIRWVPIGKSNCYLDVERSQIDTNNAFSSPSTPDALIKFVNDLGYSKVVRTLSDVVSNDMFRPWRALTTVINLCLTGKTSGFERPRAPVLQILWGIFNRAHIDYAKSSPLHLANEELVLGYLKFSAKGTKLEVFGMPIPNDLITDDIREVSDPDSPAPKPAKATKPKASKQSKPLTPKETTKKPKPAPAKPQEKKRKLVTKTSEAPSLAKPSKAGKVVKQRTKKSSLQLVDEFVDEGVPENEPRIGDEEADLQKAVEESLKEFHSARQGPLPLVVIREPESGKFQPLPETPKKRSPADQYIFQRRTSTQTKPTGHDESSSLYAELGLIDSERDSGEEVSGIDENLKLPTEGEVRLEEPASSAGTLSSLQNLDKELSFTNQFLSKKSQEDDPKKTNIEAEVQSMVTVPIHQDTSSVPLMTTPVIDLTVSQPVPIALQAPLPTITATTTATTIMKITTLPPIPPQPQQGSSDSILFQRMGELEQHMVDMVDANQALEERLDKQGSRLYKLENLNIPHQVSKAVDEIVTDAVE